MSKTNFVLRNPITIRTSEDETAINEERIIEMFPEFDSETTVRVLFNSLVDRASKQTKKLNQSLPSDIEALQLLNNKVGELRTMIDLKDQEIEKLKELYQLRIRGLESEISSITDQSKDEISRLKNVVPKDTEVVVNLDLIYLQALNLTCVRLSRKYEKQFTRAMVVSQLLASYFNQESELNIPYVIRSSDIDRLRKENK